MHTPQAVQDLALAGTVPGPLCSPHPHILLVDDVRDNRLVVEAFLENTPHRVVEAASGEEALRIFATRPFGLVLMDIMMPGLDGLETTRRIRQMEAERGWPRTAVVALTANAMREDMEKTRAAGCDLHLAKPLNRSGLLAVIARFVPSSPVTTSWPVASPPAEPLSGSNILNAGTLDLLQADTGDGFTRVLALFLKNFPDRLNALHCASVMSG